MLAMLGLFAFGFGYMVIGLPSGDDEDSMETYEEDTEESELRPSLLQAPTEEPENRTNQVIDALSSSTPYQAEPIALLGGEHSDILTGSSDSDTIYGQDGNDRISSIDGDDFIFGGNGDDSIAAGNGNDMIFGGANDDTLMSGGNDDQIYGGEGQDIIHGQSGNDTIFGGNDEHSDFLIGGIGDDLIFADEADRVLLGEGRDTITTGIDADVQVFDFDVEHDVLVISQTQGMHVDELDFVETPAGLAIQHNGQSIITLAGLTTSSTLNIEME